MVGLPSGYFSASPRPLPLLFSDQDQLPPGRCNLLHRKYWNTLCESFFFAGESNSKMAQNAQKGKD